MGGLDHGFFLVRTADCLPSAYRRYLKLRGEIEVHDDLLMYMFDSLAWIPAHNPARGGEPCAGLCMYGPTTIHEEGAAVAQSVFTTWANLFALGPPELELTGSYGFTEGDPAGGRYERLRVDRDDICARLRRLAGYCERVAASGGALYVLHIGI